MHKDSHGSSHRTHLKGCSRSLVLRDLHETDLNKNGKKLSQQTLIFSPQYGSNSKNTELDEYCNSKASFIKPSLTCKHSCFSNLMSTVCNAGFLNSFVISVFLT